MDAYRDQYATLFKDGKGVKVLGISVDADTMLAAWAKEKSYPVTFLSDTGAVVGKKYNVAVDMRGTQFDSRVVYVIDKKGKIVHVMAPFREVDPTAYTELGEAVRKATGGGK